MDEVVWADVGCRDHRPGRLGLCGGTGGTGGHVYFVTIAGGRGRGTDIVAVDAGKNLDADCRRNPDLTAASGDRAGMNRCPAYVRAGFIRIGTPDRRVSLGLFFRTGTTQPGNVHRKIYEVIW